LRHLVGVARLLAQTGEPERSVELLAFVLNNPASRQHTKDWADRLLHDFTEQLPPEVAASAQARGRQRRLEEILAELLGENQVIWE
jgi:hypothetical protein